MWRCLQMSQSQRRWCGIYVRARQACAGERKKPYFRAPNFWSHSPYRSDGAINRLIALSITTGLFTTWVLHYFWLEVDRCSYTSCCSIFVIANLLAVRTISQSCYPKEQPNERANSDTSISSSSPRCCSIVSFSTSSSANVSLSVFLTLSTRSD